MNWNKKYRAVLSDQFGHRATVTLKDERDVESAAQTVKLTLAEASMDLEGFDGVTPTFQGDKIDDFRDDDGRWMVFLTIYQYGKRDTILHHEALYTV